MTYTYGGVDLKSRFMSKGMFKTDGNLYAWGVGNSGQLGMSNQTNRSSPVQVGSSINWSFITARGSGSSYALKTDGTLWTWGLNNQGQLGLGDTTNRYIPVQVGTLSNWSKISSGYRHIAAIKTDGTLWMWGYNNVGQLGLSDTTDRSSPVQVGTMSNWYNVSCGVGGITVFTAAIKTDGSLWTCGRNAQGQLGLNTNVLQYSSFVQVGSLSNWSKISCGYNHVLSIKTDGTLWAWGNNSFGELGLNDRSGRSSPIQVGTLSDWKEISAGSGCSVALKNDGTLWSWGLNSYGVLGQSNYTHRSSPTQVGTLSNWSKISCGYHMLAIKTDGTLWACGYNGYGQLGNNTSGGVVLSLVQVGNSTTWSQISTASLHSVGLKIV